MFAKPFVYTLTDSDEYTHHFTLNSEPCQNMIFNLSHFADLKPTHYIMESNEKYKGLKGYIAYYNLQIYVGFQIFEEKILVGIDEKVENNTVHTVEGNSNGDTCRQKEYSINSDVIFGYGTPAY